MTDLAENDPDVARALRLVELMLQGDDEIDWAAGYSVLEIVEQHAFRNGASGRDLGWWTRNELDRFTQTANSLEAVGLRSRHPGRRHAAPKKPLPANEGSWFVRRVVARWLTWLLATREQA